MASNTDQPSQEAQPPAIRILIVDNDKAHAQAMVESLQRDGYECTMSTSGPAGKKQIQEGTEEWDLLHKRYYAEELKRFGIDLGK